MSGQTLRKITPLYEQSSLYGNPYAHTGNLRSHICLNFRPHREKDGSINSIQAQIKRPVTGEVVRGSRPHQDGTAATRSSTRATLLPLTSGQTHLCPRPHSHRGSTCRWSLGGRNHGHQRALAASKGVHYQRRASEALPVSRGWGGRVGMVAQGRVRLCTRARTPKTD
jgi:hypothetical protein